MTDLRIECPFCKQEWEETVPGDVENGEENCKYPTDSGPCSRTVEEGYCFQHTDG